MYVHPEEYMLPTGAPFIFCYAFRLLAYYIQQHHKTLLDLGCGPGRELLYWHSKGLEVTGADIKRQDDFIFPFELVDLDDTTTPLPWEDNSFDVVTIVQTLEHLHHPEYAVSEAVRVAKDIVIINSPLVNSYGSPDHIQVWESLAEVESSLGLGTHPTFLDMVISKPEDVEYANHTEDNMVCIKFRDVGFVAVIFKGAKV